MSDAVVLPARFNGPPESANGGYTAGRVAALVGDGPVEVTLWRPPPLERPLSVRRADSVVELLDGSDVVAAGRPLEALEVEVPPVVGVAEAAVAGAATPLVEGHPFPTCFGCGPLRGPDGLHCLCGPVAGRDGVWAVGWTPRDAAPEIVWAALDCPSSAPVAEPGGAPHVLGRIAARLDRRPEVGAAYALMSWARGADGRKKHTGSALVDGDGDVLAVAHATWIELRAATG